MNSKIIDPRNPGTAENKQLLIALFLQTEQQELYWIKDTTYTIAYNKESHEVQLTAHVVHYLSENSYGNRYSVLGKKLGQGAFCKGVYFLDITYRINELRDGDTEQYELEEKIKRDDNQRVAKILSLNAPANARRMLSIDGLKQEALKEYEISKYLDYFHMKEPVTLSKDKILLVMHYIPGTNLQTIINSDRNGYSRLTIQQLFYISLGLIDGMDIMSKSNIIYDDAKPENFLVNLEKKPISNSFQARLADVGIAHHALFPPQQIGGSLPFASPEAKAGGQTTVVSDIYSLGRVLLLLWRVKDEANFKALQNEFNTLFTDTPLKEETKKILSSIIQQMLMRNPKDRPQSLKSVRDAFEKGLAIEEGTIKQNKARSYISKSRFWRGSRLQQEPPKTSGSRSIIEIYNPK